MQLGVCYVNFLNMMKREDIIFSHGFFTFFLYSYIRFFHNYFAMRYLNTWKFIIFSPDTHFETDVQSIVKCHCVDS